MDFKLPGSSVHGIFQARKLEWVASSFSRGSIWPRAFTRVSCIGITTEPPGKPSVSNSSRHNDMETTKNTGDDKLLLLLLSFFSRVQLFCDPMDYSPPGFPIHGIFQARILEWVAVSFSRGSIWPRDPTWVSCIAGCLLNCRQIL